MKFLKKGLSCLILVFSSCLATSAFAAGGVPMAPYFDGFYAGLGGGVVSSTANVKSNYDTHITYDESSNDLNFAQNVDLGKHGVNGNIFVGFGKTLASDYYLGGELFGNLFSPKMKSSFDFFAPSASGSIMNTNTEVKNPYSFGGDIRAGYLVFPRVMLYVLFGLDYAKFKVNDAATYMMGVIGSSNDFNKWKLGIIPGFGVEVGLAEHLSLRAQYDYTFYSSFSNSHSEMQSGEFIPPGQQEPVYFTSNSTIHTKVKPSRGLFTLKLSYLFN